MGGGLGIGRLENPRLNNSPIPGLVPASRGFLLPASSNCHEDLQTAWLQRGDSGQVCNVHYKDDALSASLQRFLTRFETFFKVIQHAVYVAPTL